MGAAPTTADEGWPGRPDSIGVDRQGETLVLELPRAFRARLAYGLLVVLVAPLAGGLPREAGELALLGLVWVGIGLWVVLGLTRRQVRLSAGQIHLSLEPPWGGERTNELALDELQAIGIERAFSPWPYPSSGMALIFRSAGQELAFGHGLWRYELEWLRDFLLDQGG